MMPASWIHGRRPEITAGLIALAIVATGWNSYHQTQQANEIHNVACHTWATLDKLITGTPTTRVEIFQKLGFTDEQIAAINKSTEDTRMAQLKLLGPRDSSCPR